MKAQVHKLWACQFLEQVSMRKQSERMMELDHEVCPLLVVGDTLEPPLVYEAELLDPDFGQAI